MLTLVTCPYTEYRYSNKLKISIFKLTISLPSTFYIFQKVSQHASNEIVVDITNKNTLKWYLLGPQKC